MHEYTYKSNYVLAISIINNIITAIAVMITIVNNRGS